MAYCAKCKSERPDGELRCPECSTPSSHYFPGQKLRSGEYLLQEALVSGEREIVWKAKRFHGKEERAVEIRELVPPPGEGETAQAMFKPWLKACRAAGNALPEVLDAFTARGHILTVWVPETSPSLRDLAMAAPLAQPEVEAMLRASLESLAVLQKADGDFCHGAIQADTIHILPSGGVRFAPPFLPAFGVGGKTVDLRLLAETFDEVVPRAGGEMASAGLEPAGWLEGPTRAALQACESVGVSSAEAALSLTRLADEAWKREKSGAPAEALSLYVKAAKFARVPALEAAVERCRAAGGFLEDEAAESATRIEKVGVPPATAETVEKTQLPTLAPVSVEQEPAVEAPASMVAPEEMPPSGAGEPQQVPGKDEEAGESAAAEAVRGPEPVREPVREAERAQTKPAISATSAVRKPTPGAAPTPSPKPKIAVADGGTATPPVRPAPPRAQPVSAPPRAPGHTAPPPIKPGVQPLPPAIPITNSLPPSHRPQTQSEVAIMAPDLPDSQHKTGLASPHRPKWKRLVAVGALGVAGLIAWYASRSPVGEFRRLLDSGQWACNAQTAICAHGVYRKAVETKGPGSSAVREMVALAAPKLNDRIRKDLDLLYAGGGSLNWRESSAIAKWKEEIEPSDQTRAQSLFFQGMEQMDDNQLGPAIESFDAASVLSSKWAMPKNAKGRALYRQSRPNEAAAAYKEAAALDRGWPEPLLNLGILYTEAFNDLNNAEEQYRRALEIRNDLPVAHYFLGVVYHAKGPQFYPMSCESLQRATVTTGPRILENKMLEYANELKHIVCH